MDRANLAFLFSMGENQDPEKGNTLPKVKQAGLKPNWQSSSLVFKPQVLTFLNFPSHT